MTEPCCVFAQWSCQKQVSLRAAAHTHTFRLEYCSLRTAHTHTFSTVECESCTSNEGLQRYLQQKRRARDWERESAWTRELHCINQKSEWILCIHNEKQIFVFPPKTHSSCNCNSKKARACCCCTPTSSYGITLVNAMAFYKKIYTPLFNECIKACNYFLTICINFVCVQQLHINSHRCRQVLSRFFFFNALISVLLAIENKYIFGGHALNRI